MNKYRNKKTELAGYKFDSMKEAAYYTELELRKKAKDIIDFKVHPTELLQEGFIQKYYDDWGKIKERKIQPIKYTPDFIVYHDGKTEFVDVKGGKVTQTGTWKLKWKMLMHKYRDEPGYIFTVAD